MSDNPFRFDPQALIDSFERDWISTQAARAEDYLEDIPERYREAAIHTLLPLEWRLQSEAGLAPTIEAFASRFKLDPEMVAALVEDRPTTANSGISSGDDGTADFDRGADASLNENGDVDALLAAAFGAAAHDRVDPPSHDDDESEIIQADTFVGRYRVIDQLGKGSFGIVYRAEDQKLQRHVAIKVPRKKGTLQKSALDRYLEEARTVAGLDHPNIVPVFDVGSTDEVDVYIVSKLIRGKPLSDHIKLESRSIEESTELVAKVADALSHAHSQKVVHRDVKPSNILIDENDDPHLTDFGLALTDEVAGRGGSSTLGTPAYMSPEQARGESHLVDGRSDIFGLGVVLYELLCGERPFQAPDRSELIRRIIALPPRPPRQLVPTIPAELERICLRALEKRASLRYTSATDLALDLREWLHDSNVQTAQKQKDDDGPVTVVPKGLRCFDEFDAEFFLAIMPGPFDRNGLPESIRRWKTWVEESTGQATARVGVIYGPSGCGKSSLVRAGLLPRLSRDTVSVFIEASPTNTVDQLKERIGARFPGLAEVPTLAEMIALLHDNLHMPSRQRALIVIDQFEQWLHAESYSDQEDELVAAIRQADGERIQVLLLVRDDFFLALNRFMDALDVRLVQGENMALVDLFDKPHAERVLELFGRAYNRLDESGGLSKEQREFIASSVDSLAVEGRIFPVRLALFAEMTKDQPWTTKTISKIGGAGGMGMLFLEEAFSSANAPADQRVHEGAARAVLESLLPSAGSEIRLTRRTARELTQVAGYSTARFGELLHLLENRLRLITPADTTVIDDRGGDTPSEPPIEQRSYHLSHDYMVPSIREWIAKKQSQTFTGRLRRQLTDRAGIWNSHPQSPLLPGWWEWVKYRSLLWRTRLSDAERQYLRASNRKFVPRTLFSLTVIMLLLGIGYWATKSSELNSLRNQLRTASLPEVAPLVKKMSPHRARLQDQIRRFATDADGNPHLPAMITLAHWNDDDAVSLGQVALERTPPELVHIRAALSTENDELTEDLWRVLEDDQAKPHQRLRAAALLAELTPSSLESQRPRWENQASFVSQHLVEESSQNAAWFSSFVELFEPSADILIDPLSESLGQAKTYDALAATNLLLALLDHQSETALWCAINAADWQATILEPIWLRADPTVDEFFRRVAADPSNVAKDTELTELEKAWRIAAATTFLAARNKPELAWLQLRRSATPTVRTYVIHRLAKAGVPASALINRLKGNELDPGIRAGLLLALGEYTLPSSQIESISPIVQTIYTDDGDPGVHGAAEWLLRRWEQDHVIAELLNQKPEHRQWRINSEGYTMVRVGTGAEDNHWAPGTTFEIASTEVTLRQFSRFREHKRHEVEKGPEQTCPVNCIQWSDAAEYCNWLSKKDGFEPCYPAKVDVDDSSWQTDTSHLKRSGYRLPTAAEWKLAVRAGTITQTPFGDDISMCDHYGWQARNTENERTWPIGQLKPNDLGLFDSTGNVIEWCDDLYTPDTSKRVQIGDCYRSYEPLFITEFYFPGDEVDPKNGFRIARTITAGSIGVAHAAVPEK